MFTRDVEIISGDRRADRRYRVDLSLRYTFQGTSGSGIVRDMSRGGVLLESDEPLPPGAAVELAIEWPFRLQGVCPLELLMEGEVVRVEGNRAAIRNSHYHFRSSTFEAATDEPRNRISAIA